MLAQDYSQTEIAIAINKDRSVISRELKRNSDKRNSCYKADLATSKYKKRQKEKCKNIRFTSQIKQEVEALVKQDLSPE